MIYCLIGVATVKHWELSSIHQATSKVVINFQNIIFMHIRKWGNKIADWLANWAISSKSSLSIPVDVILSKETWATILENIIRENVTNPVENLMRTDP